MKRSIGSFFYVNRRMLVLVLALLSVAAFGVISQQSKAQENPAGKKEVIPTQKASLTEEEEMEGLCGNPDLIDCETWNRTIENLDDFFARDKNGEIPSQAGPVPANPPDAPLGTDVLVNNNAGASGTGNFTQSESDLVAFGNTVVIGFNDAGSNAGGGNKFTGFSRSTDGGVTFTDGGTLPTSAVGDAGDPVFARNETTGRIYLSTLGFSGAGTIQMWRSDDNGATWLPPVVATPGGGSEDKQWHAVDNFPGAGNGNVYLMTRNFGAGAGIFFYRSTDNGATFGPSGGVNIVAGNQGAYVAVGPDHSVYAFWFQGTTIRVRKSTDQGVTFGAAVTVSTFTAGGTNGDLGFAGSRNVGLANSAFRSSRFPNVAVNPVNGNLYVTYNNIGTAPDKADIQLVQSTDGGATWSAPVRVNDDATTTDQWQPTLAVSTDGTRLGVFYYSRQEDPANNLLKYYGRIATLSGATTTFTPSFAISDVASLPEFGRDSVINSVYMGDYTHAVATPGFFHVAWSDNREDLSGGAPRKDPNMYYDKIPLGLAVAGTVPAIGSTVASVPTSYVVNFTDPVNAASVQASDFTVDGIPATSVVNNTTSQSTFTFGSAPNPTQLTHTMAMAAGSVTRAADNDPLIAFSGNFFLPTATISRGTATVPTGNGIIEPNECNQMNIPLTNNGTGPASAVSAILSTTTPGVTISQANSAYPNIAIGGTQTNTTPFQISTSNSVACASTINLTLTVTFTGGVSPAVYNFTVGVGQSANPN